MAPAAFWTRCHQDGDCVVQVRWMLRMAWQAMSPGSMAWSGMGMTAFRCCLISVQICCSKIDALLDSTAVLAYI